MLITFLTKLNWWYFTKWGLLSSLSSCFLSAVMMFCFYLEILTPTLKLTFPNMSNFINIQNYIFRDETRLGGPYFFNHEFDSSQHLRLLSLFLVNLFFPKIWSMAPVVCDGFLTCNNWLCELSVHNLLTAEIQITFPMLILWKNIDRKFRLVIYFVLLRN